MNIPNMLTVFRIILVPVFIFLFNLRTKKALLYSSLVFVLAGVTDILDGHIARKYNQQTKLGAVLDPLADKLMNFAVLYNLTRAKLVPSWILFTIGIKELAMIVGASLIYLFKGNKVVPANIYGKVATVSFYVSVFALFLNFSNQFVRGLFMLTVALNFLAFFNYLLIFINIDKKESKNTSI